MWRLSNELLPHLGSTFDLWIKRNTGNPIRPLACDSSNPIWEASPHLQGHQVSLAIDPFSN